MKTILTTLLIFTITLSFAQDNYFVNAVNGLSCRVKPDADAIKIGKLPYGSIVEMVTKTSVKLSITDNGELIEGHWVLVKFTNFPFIVSHTENKSYQQEAYVFDGYLEPLNKATIKIEDISEEKFKLISAKSIQSNTDRRKIKDIAVIKKMLSTKVTWMMSNVNNDYLIMDSLKLDNGQLLKINQESNDYSVRAYYPKEEVLLFEGGHSSDYSISTKTGETLTTVGNPDYIIQSPYDDIRLNGHFPGQECSDYFFQEIKDDKLIYLTNFGWGSKNGSDVCYFKDFLWIKNKQFVYSYIDYSENNTDGVIKYKKGTITSTIVN